MDNQQLNEITEDGMEVKKDLYKQLMPEPEEICPLCGADLVDDPCDCPMCLVCERIIQQDSDVCEDDNQQNGIICLDCYTSRIDSAWEQEKYKEF